MRSTGGWGDEGERKVGVRVEGGENMFYIRQKCHFKQTYIHTYIQKETEEKKKKTRRRKRQEEE